MEKIQHIRGSALIGVVAAILIFSVLAAAIVPMISSSSQQTVAGQLAQKAYYLAESGFRFAAAKYMQAGATQVQKNAAIDALDGNYTLSGGQSRFQLAAYSYFFQMISANNGDMQFKAHCPAHFPPDIGVIGGRLWIAGNPYNVTGTIPIAGQGDDNITITVGSPLVLSSDPDQNIVYPALDITAVQTTNVNGRTVYDFVYNDGDADLFPLRNGRISADGVVLSYQFNDRANHRLVDVRDPDNPSAVISAPTGPIVLLPQVRVDATGIYGTGTMQASKRVVYYAPLEGAGSSNRQIFTERFNNKNNWTDVTGTTAVGEVSGNNALQVQSTGTSGGYYASLTGFTPTTTEARRIDFNGARDLTEGYLSYDTQVKVGFDGGSLPTYYASGLSFRLSNTSGGFFSSNGYGLSFMRGHNGLSNFDNIPDGFVPDATQNQKAIVLWQQTGDGAQRHWLAYKLMEEVYFRDDMESSATDQFHQQVGTRWDPHTGGRQHSGSTRNWYYGNDTSFTYDFGDTDFGVIESNNIDLSHATAPITLSFWSWHQTEPQRPATHDLKQVFVRVPPATTRTLVHTIDSTPSGHGSAPGVWYLETVDLSAYAGQTIRIQFGFNTVDNQHNNYEGWYVDDPQVYYNWPVNESTLAVRLREAMVLHFTDGQTQLQAGRLIKGRSSLAFATLFAPPLLESGNWNDGTAAGVLLVNRATSTPQFRSGGEFLDQIGGSSGSVYLTSYNDATDRKVNVIQAYYASASQGGSGGNTNPLDGNTNAYPRLGATGSLTWPPEVGADGNWTGYDGTWTAAEDDFRLIQWDAINTADANATGLEGTIPFMTNAQGLVQNAIILSHHSDLQSPDYPMTLSDNEVGLHALGSGATHTYFDDFGILIELAGTDGIPTPLQQ